MRTSPCDRLCGTIHLRSSLALHRLVLSFVQFSPAHHLRRPRRKSLQRPPPHSLQHVTPHVRLSPPKSCQFRSSCFNPHSFLALVAAPLAAQAFTVETPVYWLANTTVTVNWTSVTTDPEFFSIEVRAEASK